MEYFMKDQRELSHNSEGNTDVQIIGYSASMMVRSECFHFVGIGASLHSHYHEQLLYVKRGTIRLITENGWGSVLNKGDAVWLEPYEKHGVEILEVDTIIVDVFTPVRVDHLINHLKETAKS